MNYDHKSMNYDHKSRLLIGSYDFWQGQFSEYYDENKAASG